MRSKTLRLNATSYNTTLFHALRILEESEMDVLTLGEVTERVFMPQRFKRTYVEKAHGVPFLQGSHIIQIQPDDVKYLSRIAHKNLDSLIIRSGWLLITRSGTVGRTAIVPPEWDGWAASEHIFRVIPKESAPCPVGYLCAFLRSQLGKAQLNASIYGAVVDELTEDKIRGIRVPVPRTLQ